MFVCICRGVTDKQVAATIVAGARSVDEVTAACCAGDDCGACHGQIEEMLEEHHGAAPGRQLPIVQAA